MPVYSFYTKKLEQDNHDKMKPRQKMNRIIVIWNKSLIQANP